MDTRRLSSGVLVQAQANLAATRAHIEAKAALLRQAEEELAQARTQRSASVDEYARRVELLESCIAHFKEHLDFQEKTYQEFIARCGEGAKQHVEVSAAPSNAQSSGLRRRKGLAQDASRHGGNIVMAM